MTRAMCNTNFNQRMLSTDYTAPGKEKRRKQVASSSTLPTLNSADPIFDFVLAVGIAWLSPRARLVSVDGGFFKDLNA